MEVKKNIISAGEHELEVTVEQERVNPELEKAYKQQAKKIELPGFRKGKVPMSMVIKRFGEAIKQDAMEDIAKNTFWDIVKEQALEPISTPRLVELDMTPEGQLNYKIRFDVKPQLELKDFSEIEVQKINWVVKDEQVEEEFNRLLKANATEEETDEVADTNTIIVVDWQKLDETGTPVTAYRSENIKIDLADPKVAPDVVKAAIGKKVGESFTYTFTDQKEVEEEGLKKIVEDQLTFEGTIKSAKKVVFPELTEELFKKLTKDKFTNEADLKADIKKGLQEEFDKNSENMLENSIISALIEKNEFEPSHDYVHFILDRLVEQEIEMAQRYGYPKPDPKALHKSLHNKAEMTAKWYIISENVARLENITIDEEDLKKKAEQEAEHTGISVEKMMKYYNETNFKERLLEEKIIDFLKKNVNIKEVNADDLKSKQPTEEQEGE